jgi:hypothetical protein
MRRFLNLTPISVTHRSRSTEHGLRTCKVYFNIFQCLVLQIYYYNHYSDPLKIFSLIHSWAHTEHRLWSPPSLLLNRYREQSSQGMKLTTHLLSSAEVKNGGTIPPLQIHLHGVLINQLIKQSEKCAFTLLSINDKSYATFIPRQLQRVRGKHGCSATWRLECEARMTFHFEHLAPKLQAESFPAPECYATAMHGWSIIF